MKSKKWIQERLTVLKDFERCCTEESKKEARAKIYELELILEIKE